MLWLSYDGWFFVCQDCQYKSHVALRAAVDTDESLPGDRCQTHCSIPDYSELG